MRLARVAKSVKASVISTMYNFLHCYIGYIWFLRIFAYFLIALNVKIKFTIKVCQVSIINFVSFIKLSKSAKMPIFVP